MVMRSVTRGTAQVSAVAVGQLPGAQLGPEKMTDPFMYNVSAWATATAGSDTIETVDAPAGYISYLRAQSGDAYYDRIEQLTQFSDLDVGETYRVKALVRAGSVSASPQGFYDFTFTDGTESEAVAGTDWEVLQVDVVATSATGRARLYINRDSGSTSDVLDVAHFSVRRIL